MEPACRINIKEVIKIMKNAHKNGYEPCLTINGQYYSIDYNDKPTSEAQRVRAEGRA